jgi:transposase IS4-like protein
VSAKTRRFRGAPLLAQSVITRRMVVAGGVFAPGHLGELTRIIPFEMVDAVLAECGAAQRRLRKLPVRIVVCLLLAAALFETAGYPAVWRKLTSALDGTAVQVTAAALWQARTRVRPVPLRALFDLLCGPAAAPRTSGSWWRGLVCAIDGTALDVPDTPATGPAWLRAPTSTPPPPATRRSGWPRWWPAAPGPWMRSSAPPPTGSLHMPPSCCVPCARA